jgi:hypothetical protein
LALILAHSIPKQRKEFDKEFGYRKLELHYDGDVSLKGVFGGAPYPVFWVDMATDDELSKLTDDLTGRKPQDYAKVYSFCETFITNNQSFIILPYIFGDAEPIFQIVPERHKDRVERLKTYWLQESAKRATEEKAAFVEELPSDENLQDVTKVVRELLSKTLEEMWPSSTERAAASKPKRKQSKKRTG